MLPTVFVRGPILAEQLRLARASPVTGLSFPALAEDITKKSGELSAILHCLKYAPARASPHTHMEAELVLLQAEFLVNALPGNPSSLAQGAAEEMRCRAVDMVLMLDAAIRALQSP